MKLCKIADLTVLIDYQYETMSRQIVPYEILNEKVNPDIIVKADTVAYDFVKTTYPELSTDESEYIITGFRFYEGLIDYEGLMLHASCVVYKDNAYLFSADSGVGKSTHTRLWQELFGDEAIILNDDKPAIRIVGDTAYAYGTPWSGKNGLNANIKAPIKGICFIHQSHENHIQKVEPKKVLVSLLKQTLRPVNPEKSNKMLDNVEKLIETVSMYEMGCNTDIDAARVAYEGMR